MKLIQWIKRVFTPTPQPKRLELRLALFSDADQLIKEGNGAWRIAREEDSNQIPFHVWLERIELPTT